MISTKEPHVMTRKLFSHIRALMLPALMAVGMSAYVLELAA